MYLLENVFYGTPVITNLTMSHNNCKLHSSNRLCQGELKKQIYLHIPENHYYTSGADREKAIVA